MPRRKEAEVTILDIFAVIDQISNMINNLKLFF